MECQLTIGVAAPLSELREALAEICPFSAPVLVRPGGVLGAFPSSLSVLQLALWDSELAPPLRPAQVHRRMRRIEAQARGIVAHLVPRFGDVHVYLDRHPDASLGGQGARRPPVLLAAFLSSDEGVPEKTLLRISVTSE
jgi:hypothetical protein